jgi:hypothetical protein
MALLALLVKFVGGGAFPSAPAETFCLGFRWRGLNFWVG